MPAMTSRELIDFFKTNDILPDQGCNWCIENGFPDEMKPEFLALDAAQRLSRLLIYQITEVLFPVIIELRQELKQVERAGQIFKDQLDARDLQAASGQ